MMHGSPLRSLMLTAVLLSCALSSARAQDEPELTRDYDLRELEALAAGLTLDGPTQDELSRSSRLALNQSFAGRFVPVERERPGQPSAFVLELFQAALPSVDGYQLTSRGLSFSAPAKVHAEAAALLSALRRSLRPGVRLELRSVTAPAELGDWAQSAPGAPVSTATALGLEAAIKAGRATITSAFDAPFRDGEVRLLTEVEATEYLSGYEINQTGVWPMLNATRGTLLTGEAVQAHVCRRPGGGLRLDVHRERARRLGMRSAAFPKAGTVELPSIALERLAVSAELAPGRWTLLARRSAKGRRHLLLARGSALEDGAGGAGLQVRRYPLRSLLEPVFDFPLARPWETKRGAIVLDFDSEEEEEREDLGSLSQARVRYPDFFVALERSLGVKGAADRARRLAVFRGALFVLGPAAVQLRASAVIDRWSRGGAPARIELAATRRAGEAAPGLGPIDAAAARGLSAGAERLALAGFVGQQVQWDVLEQRAFIGDIERVSGGQGAVKVVAQPVIDVLTEGRSLRLRLLEGRAGVELELTLAPPAKLRSVTTAWGPLDLAEQGARARLKGVYAAPRVGASVIARAAVFGLESEDLRVFWVRRLGGEPSARDDR